MQPGRSSPARPASQGSAPARSHARCSRLASIRCTRGPRRCSTVPEYYVKALREHRVDVIAQPEFDLTAGEDEGDVAFDAVVEIRPEITLEGYRDLTIEIPSPHPSDDDIADQIDRLRGQYGEINTVERPALDRRLRLHRHHRQPSTASPIDGLTADDYLYEVGAGNVVPELDDQLLGTKPGDIIEFDADHPDPSEEGAVAVPGAGQGGQGARAAGPRRRVGRRGHRVRDRRRAARRHDQPPDQGPQGPGVHGAAGSHRRQAGRARHRRRPRGARRHRDAGPARRPGAPPLPPGPHARPVPDGHRHRCRRRSPTTCANTAAQGTKVDLALRAIAAAEGLQATDDDVTEELDRLAAASEVDPDALRSQLEAADRLVDLEADLSNRKALEWLTEHVDDRRRGRQPVTGTSSRSRTRPTRTTTTTTTTTHEHDHDDDDHDHEH